MTQNKKFKKLVRARMEETGETYMQARRALGGDDHKSEKPWDGGTCYVLIGYWKSIEEPHWPDPLEMVDPSWDAEERAKVVEYLRGGHGVAHFMGESWCRLGCGTAPDMERVRTVFHGGGVTDAEFGWKERRKARQDAVQRAEEANMTGDNVDMGCRELSDGTYVWPEGLAHYVEEHNVRLPQQFVDHVLAEGSPKKPTGDEEFSYDLVLWSAPETGDKPLRPTRPSMFEQAVSHSASQIRDEEDARVRTKVRAALERQKASGDPLDLLHDKEGWAATGGTEEERLAGLKELWAPPGDLPLEQKIIGYELAYGPGSWRWERPEDDEGRDNPALRQLLTTPSVLEIATPFNKGWYYHDSEYPDEGTVGPYKYREDAEQAAKLAGYDPEDSDSVTFIEQKEADEVTQRYLAEFLRKQLESSIRAFEGIENDEGAWQRVQELLRERLSAATTELIRRGVLAPPEEDITVEFPPGTEEDKEKRVLRANVRIKHPERYPEFVR